MSGDGASTPGFPCLVCPTDRLPLDDRGDTLVCGDGHRFDTRLGIPRLVAADARYTDGFGEQWNRYRTTQLDSYTHTPISRDRLKRCLGAGLWERLSGPRATHVLETGCGAGRFTEVLLDLPSAYVTSTDLSSAVEANQVNCPQTSRHRVIQCDICRLPFPPDSYDIVVCLGVIQHTPQPEITIAKLYEQVRPGGWLVIDHYTPSISHYTKVTALLLRPVLKRLPPHVGTAATEALSRVFFPLHRAVKHRPLMQMALSRVSPLLTYYQTYPELDDRLQYEWAVLDTHDSLTDFYKHFRTGAGLSKTLARLGAGDIWMAKGGNGIEARCRKPGTPRAPA
jgi:SAM-dependent methyltransferase